MGIPLPQPTSRTREPSGIDDARAVASGTPVSSTLSDAYHSAIRSYSRILNPVFVYAFERRWRNQAITQVCAFPSPRSVSNECYGDVSPAILLFPMTSQ